MPQSLFPSPKLIPGAGNGILNTLTVPGIIFCYRIKRPASQDIDRPCGSVLCTNMHLIMSYSEKFFICALSRYSRNHVFLRETNS